MAVDKKMEKPVVVCAAWFVCQFCKTNHGSIRVKCVGNPEESTRAYVRFGKRDSCNRHISSDEALLFGMHCQAESFLPVVACHFAHGDFGHRFSFIVYAGLRNRISN